MWRPSTAEAQYFGQNKVQYEKFNFKVKATEHFDIYYYPEEQQAVEVAARLAERWYARLSRVLRHELSSRQPIILYAAHPHFQQTNAISGDIGEGTGGVTEMFKRRVILPFAGGLAETDHVLGTSWCTPFSTTSPLRKTGGPSGGSRRSKPAASGSSKAWRSTCRRPGRLQHGDVGS